MDAGVAMHACTVLDPEKAVAVASARHKLVSWTEGGMGERDHLIHRGCEREMGVLAAVATARSEELMKEVLGC